MLTIAIQSEHAFTERSFVSFAEFASFHLSQPFSCHYETITGIQNAYFDIDNGNDIENAILRIQEYFSTLTSTFAILVFSSSDTIKSSYHIVVRGVHFANHKACGFHAKKALSGFVGFDEVVYTANRKFRLLGSRKIDSTRIKELYKVINHGYYTANETLALGEDQIFTLAESFVSLVDLSKSRLIEYVPEIPREVPKSSRKLTWTPDLLKIAMDLVNDKMPSVYAFRDLSPNNEILSLKRLKPSRCLLCDRVHDAEGAFVVMRRRNEGIGYAFYCRRNEETCLDLDDDPDEAIEVPVLMKEEVDIISKLKAKCLEKCTFYQ